MRGVLEQATGLLFEDLWILGLILLLPVVVLWRRRHPPAAVDFAPAALLLGNTAIPRSWRVRMSWLPTTLEIVALGLLVLAAARPMERVQLPLRSQGIDILLCMDLSSSMAAEDMDARRSRLQVAKDAAARFVESRVDDRIGLVSFAGYVDVRCPPTRDQRALLRFLDELEHVEEDSQEDLTGIGTAVARSAQVLSNSDAQSRIVVLLTDGAENVATAQSPEEIAPQQAARLCDRFGVRVYTIAAGSGDPRGVGGGQRLNRDEVRLLAERTGGRFFTAKDAAAIEAVYGDIDRLEKSPFEEPRYELQDAFLPLLIAGVLTLALAFGLRRTVLEALP